MQEVKSRIRVQIIEPEGDDVYPTVRAFHVGDGDDKVPVRYVGKNAQGQYSVALEEDGPTIYWSPDETGNQVPHTTPSQDDGVSFDDIWVNPLSDAVNDSSTVLPMPAESDWQDRILVFPEGSGIEPLYLVFKTTARNESGVVTGKGEDITGIWLEKSRTRIRSTNTIPDSR
ncbi:MULTISPECIES: S-type pyocin domain-containing protein [unclassified Photobacterium]|nr:MULTISPECIES: S-type pyocin domain-containing protein [unclassified Photobacterium]